MKRLMLGGLLGAALSLGALTTAASATPDPHGTGNGTVIGVTKSTTYSHSNHTLTYIQHLEVTFTGALAGFDTENGADVEQLPGGIYTWEFAGTLSVKTSCGRINEQVIDTGEGAYSGATFLGGGTIRGVGPQSLSITYQQINSSFTYSASWRCTNGGPTFF